MVRIWTLVRHFLRACNQPITEGNIYCFTLSKEYNYTTSAIIRLLDSGNAENCCRYFPYLQTHQSGKIMVLSNRMFHAVILTTILFHKSLRFDHSQGKDQNDILTSNHSCTKQLASTRVEIRTHASKKRLHFEVRVKL